MDKPKTVKNISTDAFGTKLGRVHIPSQKIRTIQTKKMKGLKDWLVGCVGWFDKLVHT